MPKIKDLKGKRFGRLIAIEPTAERRHGSVVWRCRCECGNDCFISESNLASEQTKSCGCLSKETLAKGSNSDRINNTRISLLKQKTSSRNSTGVKGVSFYKSLGKYRAYITIGKTTKSLGYFSTLEEATEARKAAEDKYFTPIINSSKNKNDSH